MSQQVGYKRRVVGAHYGTMDFIVQRCTAIIMAVYTVVLLLGVLFSSGFSYENWRHLFTFHLGVIPLGQMLASLAFLSVIWHAWIGVRDIAMDYLTAAGLRLLVQVGAILWLVATVIYFAKVLWSL
jgi:succinate dehydrogenase / fumarate reductase membrane anchor subunit